MSSIERAILVADGGREDAVRHGLWWLLSHARRLGSGSAAIVAPSLREAEAGLEGALGEPARQLLREREVPTGGLVLRLHTARTLPDRIEGPALVVGATDRLLARVEERSPAAVCALPRRRGDLAGWDREWGPIDIRG